MSKLSTRLCCEPGCGEVGVDVLGGWRCAEHRRAPWDRWRAENPSKSIGYGSSWRRIRNAYLAEHPHCEDCLPKRVPATEVHHVDRRSPLEPRANDWQNLRALCRSCHRRASRRRVA